MDLSAIWKIIAKAMFVEGCVIAQDNSQCNLSFNKQGECNCFPNCTQIHVLTINQYMLL